MEIYKEKISAEQKASLVNGAGFFRSMAIAEANVPEICFLDGGTGLNFEQLFGDLCMYYGKKISTGDAFGSRMLQRVITYYYEPEALDDEEKELREWISEKLAERCHCQVFSPGCYPAGIMMGATWNPKVVYDMACALGKEAKAYGVNVLLGTPYVNIIRDPRNGRAFEGYSEDPFLMTVLAPEMVRGVQEQGVAANVKHFAANNQESFRVGVDETISRRALEEIYFPAFKACVDAKAATVMSAYNAINGVPCTENVWLLTDVLRKEWGFDGMVISDWGAVYHPVEAIKAGNNLAMPGPIDPTPILEGLKNQTLKEEELEESVGRILDFTKKWCESVKKDEKLKFDDTISKRAAYNAAVEGCVLLKNEKNVFPFEKERKVAIYGKGAEQFFDCGTGSAGITTDKTGSLYAELKKRLGAEQVSLNEMNEDTDTVLVVVRQIGMEGNDRKDLFLPESELSVLECVLKEAKAKKKRTGVILNVAAPIDCSSFLEDTDGMFCIFMPGMQGAEALADLMAGIKCPCGRLPVTFPKRMEDMPTYINFPGDGKHVMYGEDIFVGYRYYDSKDVPVQFPFGYGLSYTTFAYSDFSVTPETFADEIKVSVTVTNTGDCAGKEVVALYVRDVVSTIRKPKKELKGFEKTELQPGESRQVTFTIRKEQLASYDENLGRREAEEGWYEFMIARSSEEVVCSRKAYGDWKSAYSYSFDTPWKTLYEKEDIKDFVLEKFKAYSLDTGILYATYEYNSHMSLNDIFAMLGSTDENMKTEIANYLTKAKKE